MEALRASVAGSLPPAYVGSRVYFGSLGLCGKHLHSEPPVQANPNQNPKAEIP